MTANLTIDNPHDLDWFTFTLAADTLVSLNATWSDNQANLDLYLMRDSLPDSLIAVTEDVGPGMGTSISRNLKAGRYFVVVVDQRGRPVEYQFRAEQGLSTLVGRQSEDDGTEVGPSRPKLLRRPRH